MKGKFITTQIMIVCMGNQANRSSVKQKNNVSLESGQQEKFAAGNLTYPIHESRNKAA